MSDLRGARMVLLAWPLCWLGACAAGPNFTPPRPETPKNWSADAAVTGGLSSAPALVKTWWDGFDDPVLSALIARAANANLDLRQSALRIMEARAQAAIAGAGALPSVSADASYMRQRFSEDTAQGSLFSSFGTGAALPVAIPRLPNPYDQYQAGFDASWEIDLFGGVRRSVEAAKADTQAAAADANAALISLEGEVARSYFDLRTAQYKRAVGGESVAAAQETLTLTRERRAAGVAGDVDVANAAGLVAGAQAQIPLLDRQIALDINQLSLLLAREPGALSAELAAMKPIPPAPPGVAIGLPADLVRRRPDIRAAEARLHAATARVGAATADLFPQIVLNGSAGTQAARAGELDAWSARFFSVGPTLRLPIFQGGRIRANIRLQNVREQEAAIAYAKTVLTALHDVENALIAYNTELARNRALHDQLAQNRAALDLARQRYKSGVGAFLNVLDAQRTAQQSELTLADSTGALSSDVVALYKALGGGWPAPADAPARP